MLASTSIASRASTSPGSMASTRTRLSRSSAEIGLDMTRWPTEKNFASWLSLSPGSKITGGKKISGRIKPSASRAAAFSAIAQAAAHGLLVAAHPRFWVERDQIVKHIAMLKLPAIYETRDYVIAGGPDGVWG